MLDSVCPSWRDKIISISSDGENTMTGRHAGVVTLLEKECSNPVLRIWCVAHQLDIVVKNATHGVLNEMFYKFAHAFSVHLRAQKNLINEMGSKCPKYTTRWVAFGSILCWLLEHRRRLTWRIDDLSKPRPCNGGSLHELYHHCLSGLPPLSPQSNLQS